MPSIRLASFLVGAALVAASAAATPLEHRFWTHMLQHLALGDAGPLLLVLGRPSPRLGPLERPLFALPLWAASLLAWHLTPLYDAALDHELVHLLQHVCFLVAGLALWSALLRAGPASFTATWRLPYVLGMWAVSLALSQIFLWSGHSYYARYSLSDQRAGGGVMLVEGSIVMLGVVVWLLFRVFAESEAHQRILDG
jgi:putative membrane protein